ncbi:MAG: winged helix-turn-helix transcriptional regulator [Candidatus Thorarchaeota archaeon]
MDYIDKAILIKLDGDCRLTYQAIAEKLDLTRSAVKRRVDKMVEAGVIEQFTVELSRQMINYEWMLVDIATDGTEDVEKFVGTITKHPMVFVPLWTSDCKYLLFCQSDNQHAAYDLGKFLRGQKGVIEVLLQSMIPVTNEILSPSSWFQDRGDKVEFSNGQIRVIRSLMDDARKSITAISEETGINSKRVKRILDDLHNSRGVHFKIQFNFSAAGNTNFILRLKFDETKTNPRKLIQWIQKRHPAEFWSSFLLVNEPTMICFFTCSKLGAVKRIAVDAKSASFALSAEPLVLYPSSASKTLGRIRLEELLESGS